MKTASIVTLQRLGASIIFKFFGLSFVIVFSISYLVLAILDVATGYFKNEKKQRTSARLSLGITTRTIKFILLLTVTAVVAHIITLFEDGSNWSMLVWFVPIVIAVSWNLSELKSISENLIDMGVHDPITKSIPWFVDRVMALWSDIIGNAIDKISKKISEKIEDKGS